MVCARFCGLFSMLHSCLRGLLAQRLDGIEASGLNYEEQCRKGGSLEGQEPHLERSWEPGGGLAGPDYFGRRSREDLARSEEDFGQRRIGTGAIWLDCEKTWERAVEASCLRSRLRLTHLSAFGFAPQRGQASQGKRDHDYGYGE